MIKKLEILFQTQKQYQVFLLLTLSTLFGFALLIYRWYIIAYDLGQLDSVRSIADNRGVPSFLFLVWNLFLAWVPYWISLSLKWIEQKDSSRLLVGLVLGTWLVFFPNAPYILTDLLHLESRKPVPHWYDLMLIASFAWTGLMLGFASLSNVQAFLQKRMQKWKAWTLTVSAIFLCGFGVFLGRFQRWNTWDILTDPFSLLDDLSALILNPHQLIRTLGITLILFVFLLLAYLTLNAIAGKPVPVDHRR